MFQWSFHAQQMTSTVFCRKFYRNISASSIHGFVCYQLCFQAYTCAYNTLYDGITFNNVESTAGKSFGPFMILTVM